MVNFLLFVPFPFHLHLIKEFVVTEGTETTWQILEAELNPIIRFKQRDIFFKVLSKLDLLESFRKDGINNEIR